ncbi:transcription termination/antitermination protein NusG [Palleronia caenipelagi]|uniref:NusG-like N-terminal domain-containing protein n=1 Tax=Palleronia caenipelagi TaxID=2489174 RepID=A0A547PS36_9RHOB|nr:transcription termination/antitermination NusG family protein [Palleronia caenipelagi]TRD16948.1 hypothetical protein FEV53_13500 [Palleronia caenipelagi]
MLMTNVVAQELQWFACRVKRRQVGGIRTMTIGGEMEAYKDRKGRSRTRRVTGTGDRVFVPEHILRRAGFEVFLPVKKVLRRKNRFATDEKVLVSQPLLVDWIFVGWQVGDCRWADLMGLKVVTGVMGTGGRPIAMPPVRIAQLMRQWGGGGLSPECCRYCRTAPKLVPGDVARIVEGPLEGAQIRIIELTGASAKATMQLLGGEVVTEIRQDLLEVVRSTSSSEATSKSPALCTKRTELLHKSGDVGFTL